MTARTFALPVLSALAILVLGGCDRGSAGVLVTRAPSVAATAATAARSSASPRPGSSAVAVADTGQHTWYTSASKSAKDYYCELDAGWKQIVAANLRSYPSEAALLAEWPGTRVKSPSSKC